ncbi:MAG: PIG-L family deacetylase [Chloroflexi bacterium]|nr:PIG-L family deacetylase [Chloroflexota bacterium]
MTTNSIETPRRALVVFAHPDDAEFGCSGTVARWVREGAEVYYLQCTDGGRGTTDPAMTPERLAAIRAQEQLAAARVLGVKEVSTLGYPDGELEDTRNFLGQVVLAIRRVRPDVVLTSEPHPRATHSHRDHRVCGQVALDACFPYARDYLHFPEQIQNGLQPHKVGTILFWGPEEPQVFVDISDSIGYKVKALRKHASQLRGRPIAKSVRANARRRGQQAGYSYAETFRKIEFRR